MSAELEGRPSPIPAASTGQNSRVFSDLAPRSVNHCRTLVRFSLSPVDPPQNSPVGSLGYPTWLSSEHQHCHLPAESPRDTLFPQKTALPLSGHLSCKPDHVYLVVEPSTECQGWKILPSRRETPQGA